MPSRLLPLAFLALPLVEIAAFVMVGSQIGVLATIALVIAMTLLGAILLRIQGFGVLQRIRATMEAGGTPGRELVDALMIMLAGILLILPGFVTDAIGLLLFLPPMRALVWQLLRDRIVVVGAGFPGAMRRRRGTIDLDSDEYSRHSPANGNGQRSGREIDHEP